MIRKIISGGQTGVDQAALDAAIACGIDYGGWLPAGRKTEQGPLSSRYIMEEMDSSSYPQRTEKNVVEADATLLLSHGPLTGGSALTAKFADANNKPCLHIDLNRIDCHQAVNLVKRWLQEYVPDVLNIAGPRASSDSTIYKVSYCLIKEILKQEIV